MMKPDIREADELTPERFKAWGGGFMVEYNWTGVKTVPIIRWIFCRNDPPDYFSSNVGRSALRAYPVFDGEPWNIATWEDVDEQVIGGGG